MTPFRSAAPATADVAPEVRQNQLRWSWGSTDADDLRHRLIYLLVESLYDKVRAVWEDRFERAYGFWRGFTDAAVARYLDCGIPESGRPTSPALGADGRSHPTGLRSQPAGIPPMRGKDAGSLLHHSAQPDPENLGSLEKARRRDPSSTADPAPTRRSVNRRVTAVASEPLASGRVFPRLLATTYRGVTHAT